MINFKNNIGYDEIFILDAIDDYTFNAEEFKNELNNCQGNEIHLLISSPGGSVTLGNTMANMIQDYKKRTGKKVKAVINGLCASIATQIALSADEVVMYKNSLFMIHNASCGVYGSKEDLLKQIEVLDKIDNILASTYADKTGLSIEECLDLMSKETWLNAEEALQLGFIDSIVDQEIQLVACADVSKLNFKNTSKLENLINKVKEKELEKITSELLYLYKWLDNFDI